MADALSRRYVLLNTLDAKMMSFAHIRELYAHDHDFSNVYNVCEHTAIDKFYRHDGFCFA